MSPYTQVYPEQLLGKIAKKAFATLGCSADEFFEVYPAKMSILIFPFCNALFI